LPRNIEKIKRKDFFYYKILFGRKSLVHTCPSLMPTCALKRFPEFTTFLSMLGQPHPAITPISFLEKYLAAKVA
jgi:hypothetical protein